MQTFIIALYFIVAIALIGMVLLQQGKGSEMGASFGGGGSQTVFGGAGGASLFVKITAFLAVVFFVVSLFMTINAKRASESATSSNLGELETVTVEEQVDAANSSDVEQELYDLDEIEKIDEIIEQGSSSSAKDAVESATSQEQLPE